MSSPPLGSDAVPLPKNRRKKSAIGVEPVADTIDERSGGIRDAALTTAGASGTDTVALAIGEATAEDIGRESAGPTPLGTTEPRDVNGAVAREAALAGTAESGLVAA